jgi:EAL domain-containing protein (putative c-di-GMP-specific phosphodiesterase class I)
VHRHKCVVVDDEPGIRALRYSVLGDFNLDMRGFGTAAEAIDACRRDVPDFIVLDVVLHKSDAVDVLRALATQGYRGGVQLVSGRDPALVKQVRQVGEQHGLRMLPPLPKPFRIEDVETRVIDYFAHPTDDGDRIVPSPTANAQPRPSFSLAEVLRNGWLQFHYQPKIDLRTHGIVGAELLARCVHPDHGIVAPDTFIPNADVAAKSELSARAIATALTGWRALPHGGPPLRLAINVTVDDLVKLPIAAIVREHRPRDAAWPGLILEVTEDQAVRDIALTQEIATQLQIYGIVLALDDFGAGYSNLTRLKQLPFAELKLARETVADCGDSAAAASLCQMAIDLAHQLGAVAVAEGIEKRSELEALGRLGCDLGQGYLFAQPMPHERFAALLRDADRQRRASA